MPRFVSRRAFLLTGAALGGTALVAAVGGVGFLSTVDVDGLHGGAVDGERATLNAFVVLHADGSVVINVPRTEMGQGIHTGLAMVVAEEMDLPFDDRIRVEHPIEELAVYASWSSQLDVRPDDARGAVAWIGRRVIGALGLVSTGASSSTYGLWTPMRRAGASARHMLIVAAAAELGVPMEELRTGEGAVHHAATGRSVSYGALAGAAALVSPPDQPTLKPSGDWTLIGRSQHRVDIPAKVRGEPVFGMDVVLPDMLHASIRQPPVFGARVSRLRNAAELRRTPGVIDVVVIDERSVAVIADSWWTAEQELWSLDVEWSATEADAVTSNELTGRIQVALDSGDPTPVHAQGQSIADGAADIQAAYYAPFVTHACMETMNATVLVRSDGSAEAWASTQSITSARLGVARGAQLAGVDLNGITVHVTMNGGAFGRRLELDVMVQAAYLAALHPDRPVKLVWSREEDVGRGIYRSHAAAWLRAVLGEDGLPVAYEATVAGQSVAQGLMGRVLPFTGGGNPDGDSLTSEGLHKPYYAIDSQHISSHHVPSHVTVGLWRSNGYSHNVFFAESFIDECAFAAGRDPLDYRRRLLQKNPRHLEVLERAAAMAEWDSPLPPGRGRGIAIEEAFYSIIAQVVEVSVAEDGEVTVDRVTCAADVGTVINPDQVVAQMEGAISWGLTTALMSANTIEGGAVMESNFHDFPVLRLANSPDIMVELIDSSDLPGGAGEPGVGPVAPALANAIFDATGRRLRSLPLAVTETIGERQTRSVLRNPEQA